MVSRSKLKDLTITRARLKELVDYDPVTGVFTARKSEMRHSKGETLGYKSRGGDGYIYITLDSVKYRAHELAWLYVRYANPPENIRHVNGIRHDNSWWNITSGGTEDECDEVKPYREAISGCYGIR